MDVLVFHGREGMKRTNYQAARYFDQDTQRWKWAVHCAATSVWYFPTQRGYKASHRLADKLSRGVAA